MEAQTDLIYDVGVNVGTDSAYYLHKGFRVVGIEASPVLAAELRTRFARAIDQGRYMLLNVGVAETAGQFEFWMSERSEWSSFDRNIASRNGTPCQAVQITTQRFADIVAEHGVPGYCKIDIEGNDWLCLAGMTPDTAPPFVSIEMSYADAARDFDRLEALGYTRFKLVSQVTRAQPIRWLCGPIAALPYRLRRGALEAQARVRGVTKDGDWQFEPGSSGTIGRDTPGRWRDLADVRRTWTVLRDLAARHGSLSGDWYDIHATRR